MRTQCTTSTQEAEIPFRELLYDRHDDYGFINAGVFHQGSDF